MIMIQSLVMEMNLSLVLVGYYGLQRLNIFLFFVNAVTILIITKILKPVNHLFLIL